MSYRWDFTVGRKETMDFYLSLTLGRWRGGILGFGVVGALAGWMYTGQGDYSPPVRGAVMAGIAAGFMALIALWLVVSTWQRVRDQMQKSGRESYIQETEINGFGIHVTVEKNKAKLAFENLAKVQETRKAFYLFLSDAHAWILPKAQMEDPEGDSARLRELFRTVVERKKLHLKK